MTGRPVLRTPEEMRAWSAARRTAASTLGFVPTMGALHEGHLALVAQSRRDMDVTVVSIFVNQRQFNRSDDFDAYPRPLDDDLRACADAGADAVYLPAHEAMYPAGFETTVEPGSTASPLEGAGRPGHFAGVTTVVAKLFNAVRPDRAYFGRKDYQQFRVIEAMTRDLDFGIDVVGLPTVREADGLALSSRNRLLGAADRAAAAVIPRALDRALAAWHGGERRTGALCALVSGILAGEPLARVEYVEAADPVTLGPATGDEAVIMVAVWFGEVRLIDNLELPPR